MSTVQVTTTDFLLTVCNECGSTEYTDSPIFDSLRVNRYCNNLHPMGHYFRANGPVESEAPSEPPVTLVPIDTATVPVSAADIITEINAEHAACLAALTNALNHAIKCGELLTQLKPLIPYGEWEKWMEDNLPFGARTARRYMQLAANKERLLEERSRGAVLSLREACRIIARPKRHLIPAPVAPQVDPARIIPPRGASVSLRRDFSYGGEQLIIDPSDSEGYYFVTMLRWRHGEHDGDLDINGFKRALKADYVAAFASNAFQADSLIKHGERTELPGTVPLNFNRFLFESYEDYWQQERLGWLRDAELRGVPEETLAKFREAIEQEQQVPAVLMN